MPWYTITARKLEYYQFDIEAEDMDDAEYMASGEDWGNPIWGAGGEEIVTVELTHSHDGDEEQAEE